MQGSRLCDCCRPASGRCVVAVEGNDGRYVMWSLLLRLLQDEDEQVRRLASQSVGFLTRLDASSAGPSSLSNTCLH